MHPALPPEARARNPAPDDAGSGLDGMGTTSWVEARCGRILDDELWAVIYIRDSGDWEKKAPRALRLSGPLLCKTPYEVITTYKRTDCAASQAAAVASACWASNVRILLQIAEIAE